MRVVLKESRKQKCIVSAEERRWGGGGCFSSSENKADWTKCSELENEDGLHEYVCVFDMSIVKRNGSYYLKMSRWIVKSCISQKLLHNKTRVETMQILRM